MSSYDIDGSNFLLSLETQGIKLGLKRTRDLLACCGNPEKKIKSVQIIGTNGKGSTASSLSSILQATNLQVGLYTSPHLISLNERIQINGDKIDNSYIDYFVEKYHNNIINLSCTFFEVMTVLAMEYFSNNNIDIAVLETGLGGQFDSVTACNPSLQLFTSISKDHINILGNTLEDIATQKAKAIQYKTPCLSVPQPMKIKNILNNFADINSTSITYNSLKQIKLSQIPLLGDHQIDNVNLAIHAAEHLVNINKTQIEEGINNIFWPGRNQILSTKPMIIFDVSHNDSSIIEFIKVMNSLNITGNKTLLISIQKTKKIQNTIPNLINYFDHIICTSLNDRMYPNKELASLFQHHPSLTISNKPHNSINNALNNLGDNDGLAIIGTHYWGEIIHQYFKNSFVC